MVDIINLPALATGGEGEFLLAMRLALPAESRVGLHGSFQS
jgi:hypothetical protein